MKCSSNVRVSTRRAIRSKDLGTLKQTLEEEFKILDEREKKTRSILAKLELDFARRFFKIVKSYENCRMETGKFEEIQIERRCFAMAWISDRV